MLYAKCLSLKSLLPVNAILLQSSLYNLNESPSAYRNYSLHSQIASLTCWSFFSGFLYSTSLGRTISGNWWYHWLTSWHYIAGFWTDSAFFRWVIWYSLISWAYFPHLEIGGCDSIRLLEARNHMIHYKPFSGRKCLGNMGILTLLQGSTKIFCFI